MNTGIQAKQSQIPQEIAEAKMAEADMLDTLPPTPPPGPPGHDGEPAELALTPTAIGDDTNIVISAPSEDDDDGSTIGSSSMRGGRKRPSSWGKRMSYTPENMPDDSTSSIGNVLVYGLNTVEAQRRAFTPFTAYYWKC